MKTVLRGIAALLLTATATHAQEPTCKNCPGTYIANEEMQAYVARAIREKLVDQQVRAVDIGRSNLDVGVVYRGQLAAPGDVAEHDFVSELYHIIEGKATLKVGPKMTGVERRPSTLNTVRLLNGPGNSAKSIEDGQTFELKAGDVVIIPAGTGHQFVKIDDHVTYLMVRIDPDKVTPHKSEADSKEDLKSDGRTRAGGGAGAVDGGPAQGARPR